MVHFKGLYYFSILINCLLYLSYFSRVVQNWLILSFWGILNRKNTKKQSKVNLTFVCIEIYNFVVHFLGLQYLLIQLSDLLLECSFSKDVQNNFIVCFCYSKYMESIYNYILISKCYYNFCGTLLVPFLLKDWKVYASKICRII